MPIYEFYCADCRERFERLTSFAASANGVTCPSCRGNRVRKLFSVFATGGRGSDNREDSSGDYGVDGDFDGSCACGGSCGCGGH